MGIVEFFFIKSENMKIEVFFIEKNKNKIFVCYFVF